MIRIAIFQSAFPEAIYSTFPLGSTSFENAIDERQGPLDLARASDARQVLNPHRRAGDSLQRRDPARCGGGRGDEEA